MHKKVIMLAVTAAMVLALVTPAPAQIWAELRYWPSSVTWSITGGSVNDWKTNFWGLTLRRDITPPWSISFNGDWGGESNWVGLSATTGKDSIYSVNLHRNFMSGPTRLSLFAGWGSAGWSNDYSGVTETLRVSGPRLGADLRHMSGAWTLAAWGAFGLGMTARRQSGTAPAETNPGSSTDFGAKIIYTTPSGWGFDAGYRAVTIKWDGSLSYLGSETQWSGVFFGVNKTFP